MSPRSLEIVADPDKPTIQTRRVVDAPRALVWDAFTKVELLKRWMVHCDFTMTVCEVDLRPGGAWRMVHRAPSGQDHGYHGEFREIERPARLARTFVYDAYPDARAVETFSFDDYGGKTTITVLIVHDTIAHRDAHLKSGLDKGLSEVYAKLDAVLAAQPRLEVIADPTQPTIVTHRVVDAPRALVWDMLTKPEHLKRWIGPRALTMTLCELDLRVGGKWRWRFRSPDGSEVDFYGEMREIERPVRAVRTFIYQPFPDAEALETVELHERAGKTTITTTTVHTTMQARDGHLDAGMAGGMTEGYERLDALIASQERGLS